MKNKKLDIKFSIILPAYNEEENLIRLIDEYGQETVPSTPQFKSSRLI